MTELVYEQLSFDDARALTDEVKRDAEALWTKLLRLYQGEAHFALGYASWGAYFEEEFGQHRVHGYRLLKAAAVAEVLGPSNPGVTEKQARELVPLLDQPDQLRDVWAQVREMHPDPTAADVRDVVQDRIGLGGLKSSVHVQWYTPANYVDAARQVMGGIDLDPASSELANETIQAPVYYDEHTDGLTQDWHGRVWLNPPYGKGSGLFATKLVQEHTAGRVQSAILLLNAYGFDSSWFQPLWDHPICFTNHRVQFTNPDRETGGPANANIFVYLGPNRLGFIDTLSKRSPTPDSRGCSTPAA